MAGGKKSKLLDDVRRVIRAKQMSYRTEKTYVGWIYRFIVFHDRRHPVELGEKDIAAYLTYLANERFVAAATQNQALQSILFLYREVLDQKVDEMAFDRARRPKRLPTVLSHQEVIGILSHLEGEGKLMVALLYGCGLRQSECLSIRHNDIDLNRMELTIRAAKGNKDRVVMVPRRLEKSIRMRLAWVKEWLEVRMAEDYPGVSLPPSLNNKFPKYRFELGWQYIFPGEGQSSDPRTGLVRWHYRHNVFLQRAIRKAVKLAGVKKKVTSHTFRHSFATHILESGCDIRTVAHLLGHNNIKTTMIYLHVLELNRSNVVSPLDRLEL